MSFDVGLQFIQEGFGVWDFDYSAGINRVCLTPTLRRNMQSSLARRSTVKPTSNSIHW